MKSKRNRGFTLIEVLIAFAILSLVLGVVFRTLSTGLSHERAAGLATARVLEARSILDQLGADLPLQEGTTEGLLATGEVWTLTVKVLEPEGGEAATSEANEVGIAAYAAELLVEGSDGRTLRLQSLKLGPGNLEPGE